MATANVKTLYPAELASARARIAGTQLRGKTQVLEIMFAGEGIDVVGIQEGRDRERRIREGLHYDMYVGASDEGGEAGCQVWVAKALSFKMHAFDAAPRITWVAGHAKSIGLMLLVAAHSPCEADPPERRTKFWDALHDTLVDAAAKFPGAATFLLIDTNGRVGHAPPAAGPCGTAPTNRNGASLLATL